MKQILSIFFALLMFSDLQSSNINWSTPPTVLSGANAASDAQVAIDPSGNAVAAWVENNFVKASTKTAAGSWSSSTNVSASGGSSPRLVSDSSGNATLVWVEGGVIKAATLPFGGSWGSTSSLSTGNTSSQPTLCVDSAGDCIAAWVKGANVETSTKLFGGSWATRVIISSTASANPVVAVGGSGSTTRAVIVWQASPSGTEVVCASTKTISGSWSSQQVISESSTTVKLPYVAVDSNSNAVAVWYGYETTGISNTNVVVKASCRSIATGTWSSVKDLSKPGVRNPSTLAARVAYDGAGNAIAIWSLSFDDETYSIQSSVKPVNGKWCKAVDLIDPNLYAFTPELSVTSYGDVVSLYGFYNGSALLIQSTESDFDGFANNIWSVPVTISTGTDNAYPKVASGLTGSTINAAAVWSHYDGSKNTVVAATGSKTLVLPPTSLSVSQSTNSYGVFTEYYNTLSWTASAATDVVGYNIFRNGQFLEQVGADVTSYIDNNRTQNGSVRYGVAAVNAQGDQSVTATVTFP